MYARVRPFEVAARYAVLFPRRPADTGFSLCKVRAVRFERYVVLRVSARVVIRGPLHCDSLSPQFLPYSAVRVVAIEGIDSSRYFLQDWAPRFRTPAVFTHLERRRGIR